MTVNGTVAYYVSVMSDNAISITVPAYISAYQQVTVVLSKDIGIRNPSSTGISVTIAVSTSMDVASVSTYYTTITSQVTQPQVQLTSYGAGSASGYTINFSTGAAGSLRANYDRISIVFPTGTVLPAGITREQVKMGNYPVYAISVYGNRLDITPAMNATANTSIQVIIDKTAGIKNPATAGSYTLQAYTSIETTAVTSAAYTIVNLPRTLVIISPAAADGLSGYYKTRPTVVLSASSPTSAVLTTYYSLNGGTQQIYTTPLQLPDGTDTLIFYSRDRQGNQEDPQTFTAKVDATAPTATIISPVQGAIVGVSPVTIVGKVSPGMQVSVAGSSVTVSATGDFSTSVALKEGSQTITFTVTSVSGKCWSDTACCHPRYDSSCPDDHETDHVLDGHDERCGSSRQDGTGAIVKVAGSAVTVNADGTFSMNVMLKDGDNLIEITATDTFGNQRKTSIPVTYKARTAIHLQIGNKTAMVNDVKKSLQAAPIIVKGTTMVPLRFIGEAFGATVTWDPVFQIIDIQLKGSTIRLQIGANFASVAGKKVILQAIPVILKGTTMVPIRFISEAFGAQVVWTAATQGIDITYPKP